MDDEAECRAECEGGKAWENETEARIENVGSEASRTRRQNTRQKAKEAVYSGRKQSQYPM